MNRFHARIDAHVASLYASVMRVGLPRAAPTFRRAYRMHQMWGTDLLKPAAMAVSRRRAARIRLRRKEWYQFRKSAVRKLA